MGRDPRATTPGANVRAGARRVALAEPEAGPGVQCAVCRPGRLHDPGQLDGPDRAVEAVDQALHSQRSGCQRGRHVAQVARRQRPGDQRVVRDVEELALQERLEARDAPAHVDGADVVLEQGREEGQQAPQRLGLVRVRVGIQRDRRGLTPRGSPGRRSRPRGPPGRRRDRRGSAGSAGPSGRRAAGSRRASGRASTRPRRSRPRHRRTAASRRGASSRRSRARRSGRPPPRPRATPRSTPTARPGRPACPPGTGTAPRGDAPPARAAGPAAARAPRRPARPRARCARPSRAPSALSRASGPSDRPRAPRRP